MDARQEVVPLLGAARGDGAPPPADKEADKKSKLLTVCPFILGNEFCERLCYYGLATNFVTYLTHIMGVDAATAAVEVMVFEGTCYVTPLLGAYVADSHWGRYTTILVFSLIYLTGCVCLTLTSWLPGLTPGPTEDATLLQNALLFGSLGVIALGTGGIKPNVSAFGADQFDERDPADKRDKQRFFNWFYMAINIGSLIACTGIVYVQDVVSWSLGFALPAAAMASAVLLFLAGSRHYRHVAPTESPMARVVKVVGAALKNRWRSRRAGGASEPGERPKVYDPAATGDDDADGSLHRVLYYQRAAMYGLTAEQQEAAAAAAAGQQPMLTHRNGSASSGRPPRGGGLGSAGSASGASPPKGSGGSGVLRHGMSLNSAAPGRVAHSGSFRWLESAIEEWQTAQGQLVLAGGSSGAGGHLGGYTPQQVEEVKLVLRLLPVFATTALYWTIYSMMGTFFIQQGTLMDNEVTLPGTSFTLAIPAATMALFNTGAIILLVPLYDTLLEPCLKRFTRWTLLRRIGWGMVVAVAAMGYAAVIEAWRLDIYRAMPSDAAGGGDGAAGGYGPAVVPLSILWQAPAYVLVGGSEVLASIAQLELFYDQAPDVMRSCSMALQLLSTALGSYLGGGLVAAVAGLTSATGHPWLPKDLNTGRLDLFLWVCAALMAANTLLFVVVANAFEYKTVEHVVLVQVPDEEEPAAPQLPGLPPLAARPPRPPGAAIAINASAARRGQYHYAAEGGPEEDGALYSRSLAFVPTSPALPAPFR